MYLPDAHVIMYTHAPTLINKIPHSKTKEFMNRLECNAHVHVISQLYFVVGGIMQVIVKCQST